MHIPKPLHRLARSLPLAMVLTATLPAVARAADLSLEIAPVADANGTIQIAVYDSEAGFRKQSVRAIRLPATVGTMTVRIVDLPPGDYAVMVFHDRNGNDRLDANVLGIPKEPWGGSVRDKPGFGAPGWADARFTLTAAGESQRITLND